MANTKIIKKKEGDLNKEGKDIISKGIAE